MTDHSTLTQFAAGNVHADESYRRGYEDGVEAAATILDNVSMYAVTDPVQADRMRRLAERIRNLRTKGGV